LSLWLLLHFARCYILLPSGGEEGFVVCSRRANTDSIKPPPQM